MTRFPEVRLQSETATRDETSCPWPLRFRLCIAPPLLNRHSSTMDSDADAARAARRRSLAPILKNEEFQPLSATVRVDYGAYSDIRPKGAPNEDHYLIVRLGRSQEMLATSLSDAETPQ